MKISKHIAVLVALLILISNIGLAFNVHYCEGNIASVSFDYKASEPCISEQNSIKDSCCAQQNTHENCCENSKVEIKKSTTDTINNKNIQIDLPSFTLVEIWESTVFKSSSKISIAKESTHFYCNSNAPPFYKLYSQLIFYA